MTTLIERARAFATIADYLPEERRKEIAEALATQIHSTSGRGESKPDRQPAAVPDPNKLEGHISIAEWLSPRYQGPQLVRATAEVTARFLLEWRSRYGADGAPPAGFVPNRERELLAYVFNRLVDSGKIP